MADKLPVFSIEIEYKYKKEPKNNWYYYFGEAKTLELALKYAEKHFNEMLTSTGWKSIVKLIAIRQITGPNEKAITITVDPPPTKSRSGPKRVNPTDDSETTTKDTATTSATTNTKKPEINRKSGAGSIRQRKTPATRKRSV